MVQCLSLLLWLGVACNGALALVSPSKTIMTTCRSGNAVGLNANKQLEGDEPIAPQTRSSVMDTTTGRREFGVAMAMGFLAVAPTRALADVADGNALPQGAQQFAKSIKLQKDVKDVRNRLTTAEAGSIETKEWSNIEKFLRDIYGIADNDMKAVAVGIFNPENKATALKDIEQIKKYARAGDVSAGKKDAKSLEQILGKVSDLQVEFFDSLSDIPDEL